MTNAIASEMSTSPSAFTSQPHDGFVGPATEVRAKPASTSTVVMFHQGDEREQTDDL